MIDKTLDKSVPFITLFELKKNYNSYIIFDTREKKEYETSHLKNAINISYTKFYIDEFTKKINENKTIVVYCSIGYRSEKIGKQLLSKGYKVYNLYGGIFNWINQNQEVFDMNNCITQKIHCYNKKWGNWLIKGEKIYD